MRHSISPPAFLLAALCAACGDADLGSDDSDPDRLDTGPDAAFSDAPARDGSGDDLSGGDPRGADSVDAPSDAPRWPETPDLSPLGGARPADVFVPSAYSTARAWPVVVLLHGYGASAFLQRTYLRLTAQVDAQGFILITPDGTTDPGGSQFWNAWRECCDFSGTNVDDVGYLLSLLDEAAERFHVDLDRIYFMGHSNGGYMSFRMACEAGDRVAAISPLAGAMPSDSSACTDTGPVAVLSVHGTIDDDVEFESRPGHSGAFESLDLWRARNGCGAEPTESAREDLTPGGAGTRAYAWTCADAPVELWELTGDGHIPAVDATYARDVVAWLLAQRRAAAAR